MEGAGGGFSRGGSGMKETLVMLAVTVMKTGVCIAGVRRDVPGVWIRPVRDFGSVLLGDITYPASLMCLGKQMGQRRVMRPFDLVELTLGRPQREPPHVEDWTCDFVRARPHLLGVLPESERAALLDAACCPPEAIWRQGTRSLGMLLVDDLSATFQHDEYTGKYEARIGFSALPPGPTSAPCTDLKWRALGRRLLAARDISRGADNLHTLTLDSAELRTLLRVECIWLALGLTRNFKGANWPLIVGVHTLPDYEADVDY